MSKRWSVFGRVVGLLVGVAALVSGCALSTGQSNGSTGSGLTSSATATSAVPAATPSPFNTLYIASGAGVLSAFTPQTGHLLWRTDTGATASVSGPIMDGADQGILFLTARQPDASQPDEGHVFAIDLTARRTLWSTHLVVSFLAAQAGVVYVSDPTGIAALNATNDARYWHYATPQAYPTAFAIANGVVYLAFAQDSAHAYLDAISAGDGARLWRRALRGVAPYSATVSGGRVYVVSRGSDAFSLMLETFDATSGATGWVAQENGASLDITIAGNTVYAHTTGSDVSGSVVALNAATGARVFAIGQQGACYVGRPIIAGGMLYIGCVRSGTNPSDAEAYNAQTGALVWRRALTGDAAFVAAIDGNMVYVEGDSSGSAEPATTALNATSGAILWRQGGVCGAAAGGIALLVTQSGVIAIKATNGAEQWSLGGLGNSPALLAA